MHQDDSSVIGIVLIITSIFYIWITSLKIFGKIRYYSNIKLPILGYIILPIAIMLEKAAFLMFCTTMLLEWKLWFLFLHVPFAIFNTIGSLFAIFAFSDDKEDMNDIENLNFYKAMVRCGADAATSLFPIGFIAVSPYENRECTYDDD